LEKAKIISILDKATDKLASLIRSNKLNAEVGDALCEPQEALLNLLCTLQDSA